MTTKPRKNSETKRNHLPVSKNKLLLLGAVILILVILIVAFSYIFKLTSPTNDATITFNFDKGSPVLVETQNTPFNQTVGNLTAFFSSPSDKSRAAFSIQSYSTTFVSLSKFSGKWLYDNQPVSDILEISFSQPLASLSFTFATVEYHGGAGTQPSNITLTAYMDSTNTNPIGQVSANGDFSNDPYPQGKLSLDSANKPFNIVRIEVPYQGANGAKDFYIDNIKVLT